MTNEEKQLIMNFTTIEQSKALIEAGLNPDTADMCYTNESYKGFAYTNGKYNILAHSYQDICSKYEEVKEKFCKNSILAWDAIPCWSTGALLNLMPPYLFEFSRGIDLNIYKNVSKGSWVISYLPNNVESMQMDKFRQFCFGENLIDAACDMALWLLKNGFIKKVEQ